MEVARTLLLGALTVFGLARKAEEPGVRRLRSPVPRLRLEGLEGLADQDEMPSAAAPALRALLGDPMPEIRELAALGLLGAQALDEREIPALVATVRATRPGRFRRWARRKLLGPTHRPQSVERLSAAAFRRLASRPLTARTRETLRPWLLEEALRLSNRPDRAAAVSALLRLFPDDAVILTTLLEKLRTDETGAIARGIAEALRETSPVPSHWRPFVRTLLQIPYDFGWSKEDATAAALAAHHAEAAGSPPQLAN